MYAGCIELTAAVAKANTNDTFRECILSRATPLFNKIIYNINVYTCMRVGCVNIYGCMDVCWPRISVKYRR